VVRYTDDLGNAHTVISDVTTIVGNEIETNSSSIDASDGVTAGDDDITGGSSGQNIYGLAGNDVINGAGGDDNIYGGDGNDTLDGNAGNDDDIFGEAGDDTIIYRNGDGSTDVDGGSGIDTLRVPMVGRNRMFGSRPDGQGATRPWAYRRGMLFVCSSRMSRRKRCGWAESWITVTGVRQAVIC